MLQHMVRGLQVCEFWDVPLEDVSSPGVPNLPGAGVPGVPAVVTANLRELGLWWPAAIPGGNRQMTLVDFAPPPDCVAQFTDVTVQQWPWNSGFPERPTSSMFFWGEVWSHKFDKLWPHVFCDCFVFPWS